MCDYEKGLRNACSKNLPWAEVISLQLQGPAQQECQEGCKPAGHSRRLQQPQQGRLSAAHQGNSLQGVLSKFSLMILALLFEIVRFFHC